MKLTVKEMKELIEKYEDDEIIEMDGGESNWGEFFIFQIGKDVIYEE